MKKMSSILAAAVVCAAPVVVMAEGPTSRPSTNRPGGDRPAFERTDRHPNHPNNARGPMTAEHWDQISEFMRQYSSRRMGELDTLIAAADEKRSTFLKQLVGAQYDYVMSLKNEDPELYNLQIQKIQSQDAIYGMLRDAAKKGMIESQKKPFRDEVSKLVDVNLSERSRRIEKAKDSLAKAESTLADDTKNRDALVDDRMNQFLKEGARPFKMDGPNGGPPGPDAHPEPQTNAAPRISNESYADAEQQMNAILFAVLIN